MLHLLSIIVLFCLSGSLNFGFVFVGCCCCLFFRSSLRVHWHSKNSESSASFCSLAGVCALSAALVMNSSVFCTASTGPYSIFKELWARLDPDLINFRSFWFSTINNDTDIHFFYSAILCCVSSTHIFTYLCKYQLIQIYKHIFHTQSHNNTYHTYCIFTTQWFFF